MKYSIDAQDNISSFLSSSDDIISFYRVSTWHGLVIYKEFFINFFRFIKFFAFPFQVRICQDSDLSQF